MEIIYPVSGAKLVCDKGTRYAHFYAGARFSTMGTGRAGIETDSSPENVAGNFFKCTVTGAECDKCFSGDWQNVSREVMQQDGDGSPPRLAYNALQPALRPDGDHHFFDRWAGDD